MSFQLVFFNRKLLIPLSYASGMGGDHMVFAGNIKDILELQNTHGLVKGEEVLNIVYPLTPLP